jgi:hypothetical protein
MRTTARKASSWILLALTLPLLSACAGMGLEDILSGMPLGGDVRGEVDWVDERNREINVRGGWGGGEAVRYDSRTRVVYRERSYDVRDLERGDLVSIDVDSDSRGRRYARTVQVERSVRDSEGRRGNEDYRRQRFDGRVAWVDHERGQFALEMGRYDYVVTVPYRTSDETRRRFQRLRRGDRARFEGSELDRDRIELYRFL